MPQAGAIIFSDLIGKLDVNGPGPYLAYCNPRPSADENDTANISPSSFGDVQDPGPPVLRTRASNQCMNDLLSTIALAR
jgi:hypothetical protein